MKTMKTNNNNIHDGVVIKKNNGQYWVWTNGQTLCCGLKPAAGPAAPARGKNNGKRAAYPDIVVGERVGLTIHPGGSAQICEVFDRANRLARRAAQSTSEQVIAANIDQIVAVMPLCQPAPRWNLLDRYLVSAESLEIEALICLTRADAAQDEHRDLAWFFPEMRPWLGKCRFGLDCQHDEEPGCAVRQAVMGGHISPRRYFSMMKLKEEGYFQ